MCAELNLKHTFEYDVRSRLKDYKNPRNEAYGFSYDLRNLIKTINDPLNRITRFNYDLDGRQNQTIDSDHYSVYRDYGYVNLAGYQNVTRSQPYQPAEGKGDTSVPDRTLNFPTSQDGSQVTGISGVLNRVYYPSFDVSYDYDNRYRVTSATTTSSGLAAQKVTFGYDKNGNQTKYTDQGGRTTDYQYDALNRLTTLQDALEYITEYSYDDQNNLTTVNNGKQVDAWRYRYDRNNRLLEALRPGDTTHTYEYDPAGNLDKSIDAKGQITEYTYDAHNNLRTVEYYASASATDPDKTTTLSYDDIDRLTGYSDGTTNATYSYDDASRLTGYTINYGPFSKTISQTYNAAGQLSSRTQDGITITYSYDQSGKLSGISIPNEGVLTYNQYYWNLPSQQTLPGGIQFNTLYDGYMRNTEYNYYDNAGNLRTKTELSYNQLNLLTQQQHTDTTQTITTDYQYDDLDRLEQSTKTVGSNAAIEQQYQLDAVNNRIQQNNADWQVNDRDQLTQRGTLSYQYDNNGSQTQVTDSANPQSNKSYAYNLENRLSDIKDNNNQTIATYYYDPFGRRLSKTVGGTTTYFLYAQEGLIGEYDQTGTKIRAYQYEPQTMYGTKPVAIQEGNQWGYYRVDHLGTPRLIINKAGRTLWQANYEDFGKATILINDITNPLRFPGQYEDVESGLYYNYQRYYDHQTGRYITEDPIGLAGGVNAYGYVYHNPLSYLDPYGLWINFAIGVAVGAVSGAVGGIISGGGIKGALIGAGAGAVVGAATFGIGAYAAGVMVGAGVSTGTAGLIAGTGVGAIGNGGASMLGQGIGLWVSGQDPFTLCNYDFGAAAGAAIGGALGGPFGNALGKWIPTYYSPVVNAWTNAARPLPGQIVGGVAEGVAVGTGEAVGANL